jgi:four helix bundle protein
MTKTLTNNRGFDLEDRTFDFARNVIELIRNLPKSTINNELTKQLVRSAGSVGANYIEANESLGKKDFLMRVRISRKEAKESRYWLKLIDCGDQDSPKRDKLIQEATELMKIFGSIVEKCK